MVNFRSAVVFLYSGVFVAGLSSCSEDLANSGHTSISARPLVIAHRGASSYLPEHTLEAYSLAVEQGSDFIEPDIIITKDGVLIARHENELSGTTDVAQKFPTRKTVKIINGHEVEGWFSEDFTLTEIKTLRANERLPFRDQSNNGKFKIPTFAEILELRARLSDQATRAIGVYPETKHPSYFAALGLPLEEPLVDALYDAGLNRADAPVFIQSFEVDNLVKLNKMTEVPLIQLIGADENQGKSIEFEDVARYADGIGPAKSMILPVSWEGRADQQSDLVKRAHAAGLLVHPYTFRPEPEFLPERYDGDPAAELCAFAALGIDGLFTDAPDIALEAFSESCPMTGR
ncbi:MAG: glycerophosphodiester phosphodiesterase [Candidatus Marinimicrobia bacterium]|nr:glycerophosphodiester phosphodiesterase [Candidatus Neomarinimicrobiota bacterium]